MVMSEKILLTISSGWASIGCRKAVSQTRNEVMTVKITLQFCCQLFTSNFVLATELRGLFLGSGLF